MKYFVLVLFTAVCAAGHSSPEFKAKSPGCDPAVHDCTGASRTVWAHCPWALAEQAAEKAHHPQRWMSSRPALFTNPDLSPVLNLT